MPTGAVTLAFDNAWCIRFDACSRRCRRGGRSTQRMTSQVSSGCRTAQVPARVVAGRRMLQRITETQGNGGRSGSE